MQKLIKGLFFGFLATAVLLVVSHSSVQAVTNVANVGTKDVGQVTTTANKVTTDKMQALTNRATSASELKLQACEVHRKVINLRQTNIITHTNNVQDRLGKLVVAVENFYTQKLVPQGKTIANYDALVSDVGAKNTALTTALDKVKADTDGLTCEKDQAKGQFATFRTDVQSLIKAVKDYRQSVIQLFQAVKKAAGLTEGKEASSSAKEILK